jgi:hypothetical protein
MKRIILNFLIIKEGAMALGTLTFWRLLIDNITKNCTVLKSNKSFNRNIHIWSIFLINWGHSRDQILRHNFDP